MDSYSPPGRLLDIGGRRLHLQESGEGPPIIVLEAGIGATSLNWRALQNEIARFARVISYDRAGLGWSDSSAEPLTLNRLVEDLHALLRTAEAPPPYILVGHSFGGLIVRSYALRYPERVSGIVLVDSTPPPDWFPLPWRRRWFLAYGIRLSRWGAFLARIGLVGWCLRSLLVGSRWLPNVIAGATSGPALLTMKRLAGEIGKMPREIWPMIAAHWSNPKCFLSLAAHFEALPASAAEMCAAPPLQGIPVIALTSGRSAAPPPECVSTEMRRLVAEKSGHWIHLDEPELVLAAVQKLLPSGCGTAQFTS